MPRVVSLVAVADLRAAPPGHARVPVSGHAVLDDGPAPPYEVLLTPAVPARLAG